MKFLTLLLLAGCATTSLDDLYLQRAACVTAGQECTELDVRITQREDLEVRRKNAEPPECPHGYVAFCDTRWDRSCGYRYPSRPIKFECISKEAFRR